MRIAAFSSHILLIALFSCLLSLRWVQPVLSWTVLYPAHRIFSLQHHYQRTFATRRHSQILDVEFERVDDSRPEKNNTDTDPGSKNLFELSLEADPDWNETRIPFIDGDNNYIDVKLAFMAELDGVNYGIAIPFDHAVAMTLEQKDGTVNYLTPDSEDNEELMEIMAGQLQEHVGKDLKLKRTPRILTVEGPLEQYTENWQEDLLPSPVDKETLLDESDEDLEFFHEFMKKELGEEEYRKTMEGADDELDEEMLSLFSVPGLGDRKDDVEGIEELLKSMLDSPEDQLDDLKKIFGNDLDHEGVALKLISYKLPGDEVYSLVQLLKPYALVAKYVPEEEDVRFELLTPEEEKVVIPRLEEVCKEDLVTAGLKL